MSEENKAIVRQFLDELHNKGNTAIVDELASPDYVNHQTGGNRSLEDVKSGAGLRRAAFPDLHIAVDDQIAEGDKVVTRWTMTGTHKGEYEGIAPTDNQFTLTGIFIHQLSGGKLIEAWTQGDMLGFMQQLGAIPSQ